MIQLRPELGELIWVILLVSTDEFDDDKGRVLFYLLADKYLLRYNFSSFTGSMVGCRLGILVHKVCGLGTLSEQNYYILTQFMYFGVYEDVK